MAVAREETTHVTVVPLLPLFAGMARPSLMTFGRYLGYHIGRNYICEGRAIAAQAEVYETVIQGARVQAFMLFAHVPAPVRTSAIPRLDLDRAKSVADVVRHDNIAVGNACWGERSDEVSPKKFAHDVVLAGGAS